MDHIERNVSLFGVAIAIIISLVSLVAWIKKSPVITTQKYVKGKVCPKAFPTHRLEFCEHILKESSSYWATRFLFVFIVALLLLFFALRRKRAGVACFACFLGIGLGLAGVILGRHTLGRSFSIAPKATALVTSGIYSRIRNPIYVSGTILLLGIVLILRRPALLTLLLVLIPTQIIRARREAAVLEAKFGDAYREYRKRTWF